jgi:Family of unknown function (DUF6519)/Right handed beta helix region
MPPDISRFRFDPLRDFAAVELKQGAVVLDADTNEFARILLRQQAALASDVLGRATVSQTTPDAFRLRVIGNSLTIGIGRLYVDGLLAENHGREKSGVAFDDLLSEPVFTEATPLEEQPYPPGVFQPPQRGKFLVYLDVWRREVTHVQSPDLIESAVGVETSSRLQTVWQVRLFDLGQQSTDCDTPDDDIADWSAHIAPSSGRLTTGTYAVPPANDPCELPPTGGYRGLENQLYRVEIHEGGPDDKATFKWSRENASVEVPVSGIVSGTDLELDSLGRDEVLGLRTDDWVEILDDAFELSFTPGAMRQITVTTETRRISFQGGLPAALVAAGFRGRHLRVRRWDQQGKVFRLDANGPPVLYHDLDQSSNGVIPVPSAGTTLLLEHGVTVSFSTAAAAGIFKRGDHWHFAARTADATVEILRNAPPVGIHHHYARLGIWTLAPGVNSVTDCRVHWPPATGEGHDCGCVACVTVDSHRDGVLTIQKAVDLAQAAGGGTVCIAAGTYPLTEPIKMIGANAVRLRGAGWTTRLVAEGDLGVLIAEKCTDISLENLEMQASGVRPAVTLFTGLGITLRSLLVVQQSRMPDEKVPAAISLHGVLGETQIVDSIVLAPVGIRANDPTASQASSSLSAGLDIQRNRFLCRHRAIDLSQDVLWLSATRITDNDFTLTETCAIDAVGLGERSVSLAITGNHLNVSGAGIRCGGPSVRVSDNVLTNTSSDAAVKSGRLGIQILPGDQAFVEACEIDGNHVSGFFTGIAFGRVKDLLITSNTIFDACNGIEQARDARGGSISIEGNHLSRVGNRTDSPSSVVGIAVSGAESCTIAGNSLRDFGNAPLATLRAGIATFGAQRVRVSSNELVGLASGEFTGRCVGILILAPFDDSLVSDNRVERDAGALSSLVVGNWTAISVEAPLRPLDVGGLVATEMGFAMLRLDSARVMLFAGEAANVRDFELDPNPDAPEPRRKPAGSILGNSVRSRGLSPAVAVSSVSDCIFNDNRVDHLGEATAAVSLDPRAVAVVNANSVRGGKHPIQIQAAARFTILGNFTTGKIMTGAVPIAAPWALLNATLP